MRQCIFVLGTRAQLVKIAPVLQIAEQLRLRHSVWFTGQHQESIDDLIADFGLTSKFILPENPKERSSIGKLLVWAPRTVYDCYRYVHSVKLWTGSRPLVIVHGDTLSTWLGAVAGHWGVGDIVHLESGLSSGKWNDPFPEEMLRRLTFRKARYAICPNDEAAERMQKYAGCIVVNTKENTLLDCVRFATGNSKDSREVQNGDYFVASIHRFQNIYRRDELARIVDEMVAAARFGEVHFILHPPTELRLKKYGLYDALNETPGVQVRPRMPYTEFLALMSGARAVFSDGGSNQEELSYLGVPTLLYRDRSERPDGLGANIRLRNEIRESLQVFIESGGIDRLRTPSRIEDDVAPSRATVDVLLKWAGAGSNS
ncbi:MAG: UDP-N-acetylglucosamine 2-epimerase [Woeseiaceae bacterium]